MEAPYSMLKNKVVLWVISYKLQDEEKEEDISKFVDKLGIARNQTDNWGSPHHEGQFQILNFKERVTHLTNPQLRDIWRIISLYLRKVGNKKIKELDDETKQNN